MENAIIFTVLAAWVARETMCHLERRELKRERSELLDRIMSVDYQEYRRTIGTPAAQRGTKVRMSDEELAKAERER